MSKFSIGDRVRKIKGSSWQGIVVGTYSTKLTPEGYAVESEREPGSVQIYPAAALEKVEESTAPECDCQHSLVMCKSRSPTGGYRCTLPAGHIGPHKACGETKHCLAMW